MVHPVFKTNKTKNTYKIGKIIYQNQPINQPRPRHAKFGLGFLFCFLYLVVIMINVLCDFMRFNDVYILRVCSISGLESVDLSSLLNLLKHKITYHHN